MFITRMLSVFVIFGFTLCSVCNATAEEVSEKDKANNKWEFKATVWGWLPTIEAELPTGDDIKMDIKDILENLDMAAFTAFEASKGKWTIHADQVYFDVSGGGSHEITIPVGPLEIKQAIGINVSMTSWVINLTAGYRVFESESTTLDLIAGTRYFWLEQELTVKNQTNPERPPRELSADDYVLDAVIGISGHTILNPKWDLDYRVDIGGGDSDLTWEANSSLGYGYEWGQLRFGYRYTHYDYDDSFKLLNDLDVFGPYFAAVWSF